MKYCEECGARVKPDSIYCDKCGRPLLRCKKCGAILDPELTFCEDCGARVPEPESEGKFYFDA